MRRRSHMEISSMIVILSIFSIVIQFIAYYFLASTYLILAISCLIIILCTHILLEQTLTFEACFIYTILILFISLIITLLTYFGTEANIIPFTNTLYIIIALNWSVPTTYCLIQSMFDHNLRIKKFHSFYRNVSIVFILFYIVILIYGAFTKDAFPWAYRMKTNGHNFIPFWNIATQIENYINKMIPLSDIVMYLLSRILIYIPYGFYGSLMLRNTSKLIRFIFLLFLPSLINLIQYFIIPSRCDIDDIIYGYIGGVIGVLLFYAINTVYRGVSGRDFLSKNTESRYFSNSIHF